MGKSDRRSDRLDPRELRRCVPTIALCRDSTNFLRIRGIGHPRKNVQERIKKPEARNKGQSAQGEN